MKPSTKQCPNCGSNRLRLFRSINEKQCDECLTRFDWLLDEGQEPLIGSSRDRGNSVSCDGPTGVPNSRRLEDIRPLDWQGDDDE